MAQDLSQTIQEGMAQTLTDLLGIDAKFQETTKVDARDIQNDQLLQVNAEFEFDKLSTILKFMVPASTASIVFNTMMGAAEFDISDEIDDDTTDAMGEFISNVSGSLVTAFNAKEVEELGKAKFNIQHKEVLAGSSIDNIDTMYRFLIELDDTPLTLFINFDEQFLPYIEEITKTEPTSYPEEETPPTEEEEIPQEETKEEETNMNNDVKEEAPAIEEDPKHVIQEENNTETEEPEDEEPEDEEAIKKAKKMKLLIIIVSALIAVILIAFLTLYFMSSDEENMENPEQTTEQVQENKEGEKAEEPQEKKQEELKITSKKTLKKVDFDIKDIDTARLNGRLATLTKFEILSKEELEAQKKEEVKRLERLKKEEELKEFAKLNKEEPVKVQPKPEPKKEETSPMPKQPIIVEKETKSKPIMQIPKQPVIVKEVPVNTQEKEIVNLEAKTPEIKLEKVIQSEPEKLLFVLTNNIKYTLFKSLVLQTNSSTARISMCNDNEGRTTILIGPFENMEQQNKMDQLIKDSKETITTSLEELTKEEFNQRCNF